MTQAPESHNVTQRSLSPNVAVRASSENERFPSFDYSATAPPNYGLPAVAESPAEAKPIEYKWPSRRASQRLPTQRPSAPYTHRSKRSVSDALARFRNRQGSVSENAQELAEALKAPVSWKLIVLCIVWYMTSALTNTSSKSILNAFPQPVTLTIAQFASVSLWCLILTWLAAIFPPLRRSIPALKNGLRPPSWDVLSTALPLSVFQLLGHLLSSYATSKIPVSLVHTIKGLSPLFTVMAYRFFFRIKYARATYLSLVPLTVGVMLACSTDFSANFFGIAASFIAAIVFVTQNIFSKKLFTASDRATADGGRGKKLDKLNLLCYCSLGAFMFTAPVWLYTEGFGIMEEYWSDGTVALSPKKSALDHGPLVLEFVFNGVFHFAQNIMAFILLSMMSPVSYSVASLIKRVWVIVIAVIWFRSSTTRIQMVGIALTCFGLYLYDRTSSEDAAERRTKTDHFRHKAALLPVTELAEKNTSNGHPIQPVVGMNEKFSFPGPHFKRDDDTGRSQAPHGGQWLPPGTRQESTWEPGDRAEEH
ncbi:hypothetical protein OHC33_007852 [Knufia fluminis]|uniref:Sugar phosphate transporter domain-containing protein n=1 Tax=Knufia fluminis TaxID=191047 RepID=A0AAN8EB43_9EURO|nr:hypothetical protein OHC33_007852 [Knufia fluminis]